MQSTRYLNSSVWFLCIRSWQRRIGWYYLLFRIRTGVDNNFSQKYIKEWFFFNFIRQKTEIGSSRNGSELTDFTFFHKIQTTGYFYNPRQQSPPLTLDRRTSTSLIKNGLSRTVMTWTYWLFDTAVGFLWGSLEPQHHWPSISRLRLQIFGTFSCRVHTAFWLHFSQMFCWSIVRRSVIAVAPETWQNPAWVLFWLSCNNQVQSRCIKSGVRHPPHVGPMKTSVAFFYAFSVFVPFFS